MNETDIPVTIEDQDDPTARKRAKDIAETIIEAVEGSQGEAAAGLHG
jgi:hypothetical protein